MTDFSDQDGQGEASKKRGVSRRTKVNSRLLLVLKPLHRKIYRWQISSAHLQAMAAQGKNLQRDKLASEAKALLDEIIAAQSAFQSAITTDDLPADSRIADATQALDRLIKTIMPIAAGSTES